MISQNMQFANVGLYVRNPVPYGSVFAECFSHDQLGCVFLWRQNIRI